MVFNESITESPRLYDKQAERINRLNCARYTCPTRWINFITRLRETVRSLLFIVRGETAKCCAKSAERSRVNGTNRCKSWAKALSATKVAFPSTISLFADGLMCCATAEQFSNVTLIATRCRIIFNQHCRTNFDVSPLRSALPIL